MPRARGYTLVELMIVIVILGLVAAVVVPQFGGTYQEGLLRAASRELVTILNLSYSEAVSSNREHRVQVDLGEQRYWLEARDLASGRFKPVTDVPGAMGAIDRRLTMKVRSVGDTNPSAGGRISLGGGLRNAAANTFYFYPDGTATGREIELRDRDGFGVRLRVNPTTARVDLEDLERVK